MENLAQLSPACGKEEMEQYRTLFLLSNDLLCLAGMDGSFRNVNPAFTKTLGWEADTLLKTNLLELVYPDDTAKTEEEIRKLKQGIATVNFVHRLRKTDGNYVWVQWMCTPEPASGNLFAIGRDITQTRIQEQSLQERELTFRTFFENSQGLMGMHDLDGVFLSVNAAGANSMGYVPEEIQGKTLYDIVSGKYRDGVTEYLNNIREQKTMSGILYTRHRNGTTRIWLYNNVLEISVGKPYVMINALDITERHTLEADLKVAREMLEQTGKVARIGSWQLNVPQQKVFWSESTRMIHEVPPDYQPDMEKTFSFFKAGESREQVRTAVQNAILSGRPWDLESVIITARGKEIWVRSIGAAEFVQNNCRRLYGTIQDIDEKKRLEIDRDNAQEELINQKAILSAFVRHTPAAVAMFDRDLRYIAYSNNWLTDYDQGSDSLLGKSIYSVYAEISREFEHMHLNALMGKIENIDAFVWRPPGWDHDQHLRCQFRPWYQFDGEIGGIMILSEDITVSATQKEELKQARVLAEEASKAKSEFLANMSHEIRTPLNGIIGFVDLILKTHLNETQFQYLSMVNQSAGTLLNIINDILDFSKIEAGKLELDIVQTDLFELSGVVTDIVKYQAQSKGLEMLHNVSPDLPRFIWTDPLRLKQILVNLLSNAIKFTEKGEIELRITPLSKLTEEVIGLRIEVRDTGIGIHPDRQSKIFEAFSQEDSSITKKYGGTGLGLTISNKLLGLMNSKLQLHSAPDQGSIFFFEIAFRAEYGDPLEKGDLSRIRKVLIVDDNEHNRVILEQMLLLKDIETHKAANGFEALQLLTEGEQYDVLIVDYHMPIIDGLETIRKVREMLSKQKPLQPIIFLYSSSDDEKVIRVCDEFQVDQRLIKPVKMQDLYTALANLYRTEKPMEKTPGGDRQFYSTSGLVILLVEDNQVNLHLARTILGRILPDAAILEARNGAEALERIAAQQPSLVLMDIQMPVMNGYEAARRIRDQYPSDIMPIVALTAGNVKGEREKCLAAGMNDFLAKPFVEDTLFRILEKWVGPRIPSPDPPVLDLEVLQQFLGVEAPDELVQETLVLTLQDCTQFQQELDKPGMQEDPARIRQIGHSLYGIAAYIGLRRLAKCSRDAELSKEEPIPPEIIVALRQELKRSVVSLENTLKGL
ncbi:MAG: PAS domain S-box protein [Chitinophagaceae bacterium]|nr:PAS domain S-box protein [Chitinophagaceae bacterium]